MSVPCFRKGSHSQVLGVECIFSGDTAQPAPLPRGCLSLKGRLWTSAQPSQAASIHLQVKHLARSLCCSAVPLPSGKRPVCSAETQRPAWPGPAVLAALSPPVPVHSCAFCPVYRRRSSGQEAPLSPRPLAESHSLVLSSQPGRYLLLPLFDTVWGTPLPPHLCPHQLTRHIVSQRLALLVCGPDLA